jgi:hypothetical protein
MRPALLFMGGLWLFGALTITGPFHSLEWDSWRLFPWDPFGQPLADTRLAQAIGDDVLVWSRFAGRILPLTFVAALVLAGNGVRGLMYPSDASASYTLTLPISRTRLVWTRLVAAVGAVALAGVLVSAAYAAVLVMLGQSVPLVPVVQSLALGVLCAATSLALGGAIVASVHHPWAWLFFFAAVFPPLIVPISYTVAAPARGEVPWGPLAAGLAITALAVAITVYRTSAKEY